MKLKKFALAAMATAMTLGVSMTSLAAGFVHTRDGVKYQWGDGKYCENGWVQYKNHWYYFGSDQLMRTGWIHKDNTWYFASDSGELQAGLLKINGNTYYMNTSTCAMATGDLYIRDKRYHFTENGTTDGSPYVYTEWNSNGTLKRGTKFRAH